MNIDTIMQELEANKLESDKILTIALDISSKCTQQLDAYVTIISDALLNVSAVPNDILDSYILNLPIYIYYASAEVEKLGLNEDIVAFDKKEAIADYINKLNLNVDSKKLSVSAKQSLAEQHHSGKVILNSVYSMAYKMSKAKIDCAYELLASCKKVMSRRIEEIKTFNSDTKRVNNDWRN